MGDGGENECGRFFCRHYGYTVLQTNNLWWTNRPEITLDTQCRLRCSAGHRYRLRSRNVGVLRYRSIICYRLLCGAACVIWFLNFSDPVFIQCQIHTRTVGTRSIVALYCHYVLRISSNSKTDNDMVWNNNAPILYIILRNTK